MSIEECNDKTQSLLIDRLHVFGLEWWSPNDKGIEDDTDRPRIDLEAVPIRGIKEYLGCDVIGCSTYGLLPFPRIFYQRGKSEIADLDVHVCIQEQITQFKIAMNDLVGMHVVTCAYELNHEESGFWLGETTSATKKVHQRA